MVVGDGPGPRPQPLHEWARDTGPIGRMSLDGLPFAVVELPRLVQDVRADLELADVVEEGSPPELVTVLLRELQFLSQKIGEDADPFRVSARPAIVRLERRGQREDGGGAFGFLRGRGVALKLREPVRKALHAPDLARHGEARGGPVREQHGQLEQRDEWREPATQVIHAERDPARHDDQAHPPCNGLSEAAGPGDHRTEQDRGRHGGGDRDEDDEGAQQHGHRGPGSPVPGCRLFRPCTTVAHRLGVSTAMVCAGETEGAERTRMRGKPNGRGRGRPPLAQEGGASSSPSPDGS